MTDEEIQQRVRTIIEEIRPSFQMDGGDVIFQSFEDGIVRIRLEGSCTSSEITCSGHQEDIRERLVTEVSQVHEVMVVTE